jgi:Flp pilus assembly protein TadG
MRRRHAYAGAESGSAPVELMMAAPVLIAAALVMVLAGRYVAARMAVESAAHNAARTASIADDDTRARGFASAAAQAALEQRGLTCADHRLRLETAGLRRGAWTAAEVTCTVALADLALLGLPGSTDITARATSPIDTYKSEEHTP